MPTEPNREKRWSWWGQIRDTIAVLLGAGILLLQAYRDSWNPVAVVAALTCLGILSASQLARLLLGRTNGK